MFSRFVFVLQDFFSRNAVICAALLGFLILCTRSIDRIFNATLWAEDGAIYFTQVYADPLASFGKTFGGYYQLVPRIAAFLGYLFVSVTEIPIFTSLFSIGYYAVSISIFAGGGYDWLIPSPKIRFLLVMSMCFLPGLGEMAGNLVNLTGFFVFFLSLLFLKDIRHQYAAGEIILGLLAILTQGAAFLFLPLLLIRIIQKRRYFGRTRQLWPEIFLGAAIVGHTLIASLNRNSSISSANPDVLEFFFVELRTILSMFVIYPWAGHFTKEILGLIFGPFLIRMALQNLRVFTRNQLILLYASLVGNFCYPFLTFFVREGAAGAYVAAIGHPKLDLMRYAYLMPAIGLVFWTAILLRNPSKYHERGFWAGTFLCAFIILSVPRFFLPYHENYSVWKQNANQLRQAELTGCPTQVVVPIWPPGWNFTYSSPQENHLTRKISPCQ